MDRAQLKELAGAGLHAHMGGDQDHHRAGAGRHAGSI
jgi:hypothetical protein